MFLVVEVYITSCRISIINRSAYRSGCPGLAAQLSAVLGSRRGKTMGKHRSVISDEAIYMCIYIYIYIFHVIYYILHYISYHVYIYI